MKKLLFLLVSLAVVASASAGVNRSPIQKKIAKVSDVKYKVEKVTRANSVIAPSTPIPFYGWDKQVSHILRSDAAITWDFEDESQFNEFQAIDADGDGFNWVYFNMTDVTSGRMTPHGGEGLIASASYDKESGAILYPDNWLVSPQVTLGGALSFWAEGQDEDYAAEVFGVYVCVGTPTDFSDFVQIGTDYTATGSYVQYEIDLSEYQGQVGCFAIVHHNVHDMFWLNVDDITLDVGAVVLPYPVVDNLTVEPATTSAFVDWDGTDADAYTLRWRPYVDTSGNPIDCDLNLEDYAQDLELGWSIYDADGDGFSWGLAYSDNTQTDLCFMSESWSYDNYQALDPDNWLFSPDTKLQGELRFTVWGYSNSYTENFQVYAIVGEDMYQLFEEDITTTTTPTDYVVDLSEFEGEVGYIGFRHYNCPDNYWMYLDNIFIGDPNAEIIEPAAWNYEYQITDSEFNIEGLTPETTYEVQVMGNNEAHESDWTEIVQFTTLADEPVIPNVYILGQINEQGWAPNVGTLMDYNAEDNIYTATVNVEADHTFGFTTEIAENDDAWDYIEPFRFGPESNGDFWLQDEYLGQPLTMTFDAYGAVRVLTSGEYNVTVDLENMKLIIEKVEPEVALGDVNMDGDINIKDVTDLINYLLTEDATGINLEAANCNGDTTISIADVTVLINYLLTEQW